MTELTITDNSDSDYVLCGYRGKKMVNANPNFVGFEEHTTEKKNEEV